MTRRRSPQDELMTPREVAAAFGVTTRTVWLWQRRGRIRPVGRTLGGHHRYGRSEIESLAVARTEQAEAIARLQSRATP